MKKITANDGQKIHYQTWGNPKNTAVVLLQGLGMDSRGYGLQRYLLSNQYYCVVVDHRGSGNTKATKPFSLYRLAYDVLEILDNEKIDNAHIVGSSMGGIVAQILGVLYPSRVRSLSLISTSCRQLQWRADLLNEWKTKLFLRNSHVLDKEILSWLIGPRLLHRSTIFLPLAKQLFQNIDIDGFCLQIDAVTSFSDSFADRLGSINIPTNIIVGSQDTLTPVGDSEEITMYIRDSKLSIIYGCAHAVSLEAPIAVTKILKEGFFQADNTEYETVV